MPVMYRLPTITAGFVLAATLLVGCGEPKSAMPEQAAQTAAAEPCVLSLSLNTCDYRGGEGNKHWHLTSWSMRNDSAEPINEAVLMVALFDEESNFLGHHAVTFQHVLPGETATQKRLLFLKSDNIALFKPRCESVQSPQRGEVAPAFQVVRENSDTQA